MLGCMGNSHWKMPCINLHGMSLVVVVFLVVELILYIELTVETWSCWIACGNTVVLVEWMDYVWNTTVLEEDWSISPSISSLSSSLEIILFAELLYLSGWLDVCWKHVDLTICSPYWRDANTASILTPCCIMGQQTQCLNGSIRMDILILDAM